MEKGGEFMVKDINMFKIYVLKCLYKLKCFKTFTATCFYSTAITLRCQALRLFARLCSYGAPESCALDADCLHAQQNVCIVCLPNDFNRLGVCTFAALTIK